MEKIKTKKIQKGLSDSHKKNISVGLKKAYKEGKRIHHFKGKNFSEEHKRKISLGNKGKKRTDEFKDNASKRLKELFEDKSNHPCFLREMSSETKRKIGKANSKKMEEYWKNNPASKKLKEKYQKGIKDRCDKCGMIISSIGINHRCSIGIEKSRLARIGTKQSKETIEKRIKKGNDHYNWKGGISHEPYDKNFNEKFKRATRKRDNQICMLCGIHREKMKKALDIHHINYNKKLTIKENCISLCNPCHTKTNHNREHWTKFFQSLLSERYNYNYSELNEVVVNI